MSLIKKQQWERKEIEKENLESRETFLDEKSCIDSWWVMRVAEKSGNKRGHCVLKSAWIMSAAWLIYSQGRYAASKHKVTILQIAKRKSFCLHSSLLPYLFVAVRRILWLTLGVPANKPFNSSCCVKAKIRSTEAMSLRKYKEKATRKDSVWKTTSTQHLRKWKLMIRQVFLNWRLTCSYTTLPYSLPPFIHSLSHSFIYLLIHSFFPYRNYLALVLVFITMSIV